MLIDDCAYCKIERLEAVLERAEVELREYVAPYIGARADHVPGFIQRAVSIYNSVCAALRPAVGKSGE